MSFCQGLNRDSNQHDFIRVGRWWSKEGEIDIVGLSEDESAVVFGEAKWSVNPVGTDILDNLSRFKSLSSPSLGHFLGSLSIDQPKMFLAVTLP